MRHTKAEELHASDFMTHGGLTQDDIVPEAKATALGGVVNAVKDWNQRRIGYLHLTRMDDHLLRDIGLTRLDITTAAGGGTISFGGLFATLAELARKATEFIKDWNQRRHDYWHLSQMDDHMLADIGLRRHEIKSAIHGKISKPARQSAISVDTLLSTALPGVATNQGAHRRAA